MFDIDHASSLDDMPSVLPSYIREVHSTETPRNYKSVASRRAVTRETASCVGAREVIFGSESEAERDQRLRQTVFGAATYERLPKFRKAYVQGYIDGMQDAVAVATGKQPSKRIEDPPIRVPKWVDRLQPGATWRRHPLGGGWVSTTAYVEQGCYVGPQVAVFDRARVIGRCRLFGEHTRVFGDAEIWGSVHVRAGAHIHGDAQLTERCRVIGVEVDHGRLAGVAVIKRQDDLRILTTRRDTYRPGKTLLPPPLEQLR